MGADSKKLKKVIFISILVVILIIIAFAIYFVISIVSDKSFNVALDLKKYPNGEIQITDNLRKKFLEYDYFANIVGPKIIPADVEEMTLDDVNNYNNMMTNLFIALYYNGQLEKLEEPTIVDVFDNTEYDYRIKSGKLIDILYKVYGKKATKEELLNSAKYANTLHYNELDDFCYVSSNKIYFQGGYSYIGVERLLKEKNTYTMDLNYYYIIIEDATNFEQLLEDKNNNDDIITGNFSAIDLNDEHINYTKKRVKFSINSIFGKNKFKILSIEDIS